MITQIKAPNFIIAILIGIVLLMGRTLAAAEKTGDFKGLMKEAEESGGAKKGMDQLISLDLRGLDVTDALKYLSIRGGMNIVVGKNVTGQATFMLTKVSVRDIFDIILRSSSLAYEKHGNVYTIMTEKEYQQRYGKEFSDVRKVKIFRLEYAIPENVFTLIDALKSEIGRVVVDQDSGTVLIMDTPEKITEIEEAVAILEKKNCTRVFELRYAKAKDIEEQLKERLDAKKVGTIRADERSNQVIVQTFPERMKDIEQIIASLDEKTREVLIDVKIIKISLSNASDMGTEWEGLMKALNKHGLDFVGSHPFSALNRLGTSFIDDFATRAAKTSDLCDLSRIYSSTDLPTVGNKNTLSEKIYFGKTDKWEAVLKFLETMGHTKILSNPRMAVVNNQEAKILVGQRQAYVTTTTTTGQTTSTVSEEVTFIDVGIQLAVTPTITPDGYVRMKVKPEISSVVGTLTTPTKNKIPIVDTSTAETTVLVKDKSTIVIGGLRKDEKIYESKRVPFLSKIPIIGRLFRSDSHKNEQTELLVLITPHIVKGDRLVTGNDFKEPGERAVKPYRNYSDLQTETEIGALKQPFGKEDIKLYRQYPSGTKAK